ncbi:hypothetical protein J6590_037618 [Homalodisca vitripennis]|nr:hypothetical protein J6590_037618 [Homalodisca vitripennis]
MFKGTGKQLDEQMFVARRWNLVPFRADTGTGGRREVEVVKSEKCGTDGDRSASKQAPGRCPQGRFAHAALAVLAASIRDRSYVIDLRSAMYITRTITDLV